MAHILDTVYFGRLDRSAFFVLVSGLLAGFALMLVWVLITAQGVDAQAAANAMRRSGNLLDAPGILLAHGVSEARTAGIMTLIGLMLTALLFALAARARDIGLWGWPTAVAALPVFLFAGQADPRIASLVWVLAAFCLLWPSRTDA